MTEMRRRQAASVEELLQEPYLDAEEQKEVVHQLKQQHTKQSRQWAMVFAVLAVVLGTGCMYLSWHQLRNPWGLRHHAHFSGAVSSILVVLAEACSGASLLGSAVALHTADISGSKHSQPHTIIRTGCMLSAVLTGIFWMYLLNTAAHFQEESIYLAVRYAWLPFGPLAYLLLVLYFLRSFGGTAREVASLQSSMYNFHTA